MNMILIGLVIFTILNSSYGLSIPNGASDKFCDFESPCHNNATCIDSLFGSYKCVCQPGFSGDHCEFSNGQLVTQKIEVVINYCGLNEPCINNGTCTKSADNSNRCVCPPNFTGIHCELYFGGDSVPNNIPTDPNQIASTATPQPEVCKTNSTICLNGGTCKNELYYPYYSCLCTDGVSGDNCETNNYTYNDANN